MKRHIFLLLSVFQMSVLAQTDSTRIAEAEARLKSATRAEKPDISRELLKLIGEDDPTTALKVAKDLVALGRETGNSQTLADGLYYSAKAKFKLGEKEEVLDQFLEGLALYQELGDQSGEASLLNALGLYYRRTKEFQKALESQQESLRLRELLSDSSGMATSLNNMASVLKVMRRIDEAVSAYDRALNIAKRINDKRVVANVTMNIGNIEINRNQNEAAIEYYKQALNAFREINNKIGMSKVLGNIGLAYSSLGDYVLALDHMQRALKINTELGDKSTMASSLSNIGNVYYYVNEPQKALDYHTRALALLEALGGLSRIAISHSLIASDYDKMDSLDLAIPYFRKALVGFREINICYEVYGLVGLAGALLKQEESDSATFYFEKALNYSRQCQDVANQATALIGLGEIHRQSGEIHDAENLLLEGFELASEAKVKELVKQSSFELFSLYSGKEQFRKALDFHIIFQEVSDSLFNEESTKKLTLLGAEYAFNEEKQQLLIAQEREELMLQSEIDRRKTIQYALFGGGILFLILFLNFFISYRRKKRDNEVILDQKVALEHLSTFKEGLTHMIAHDMKNALNTIIGLSESDPFDKKQRQVSVSGRLLLNMVSNMLEVQKFEEAAVKLAQDRFPISRLVEEAHDQVKVLLTMKSVSLHVPSGINGELQGDFNILIRVLVNLLTNAIKYSDPGKKVFIKVDVRDDASILHLAVQDEGSGIPEAELPGIFEKYGQVNARSTGHASSTGLGLAYCKLAIEAHGGDISVKSEVGKGTTIHFSLPHFSMSEKFTLTSELQTENPLEVASNPDLEHYKEELAHYEVYQIGKINSVLREMEEEGLDGLWIARLREAVHKSDKTAFKKLLQ